MFFCTQTFIIHFRFFLLLFLSTQLLLLLCVVTNEIRTLSPPLHPTGPRSPCPRILQQQQPPLTSINDGNEGVLLYSNVGHSKKKKSAFLY